MRDTMSAGTSARAVGNAQSRRRWQWLALACICGALYVWIFARFAPLPESEFKYRDDGIITLSHAKNLVDFGAIGVDPAGARVEGFSSPLQFWIFACVYALTRCGYAVFLDVQGVCCTFLLGASIALLFRPHPWRGAVLTVAIGFWFTTSVRFFGWHRSGMENAYTHVLLVAFVVWSLYALERGRVHAACLVCAWLASLTRVESILHIAPMLAIWSVAYFREHRSLAALRGSAFVLLGWGAYQVWRWAYFGSLQPNTAVAEDIDILALLRSITIGHVTGTTAQQQALGALRQIAGEHRAYLALCSIPLLALSRRSARASTRVWLLGSLLATGLLHPLLFGPARLDPVRTTSHVALIAPLLVLTQWNELPGWATRAAAAVALSVVVFYYLRLEPASDKSFCCVVARADRIADICQTHAREQGIHGPSLANPDLGRISFRKQFLLFDLGLLGSPPLAQLRRDPRATARYLLEFAQPDYIEMHGAWVCGFRYLQSDARFRQRYSVLGAGDKLKLSSSCGGRAGIWFRSEMARDSGSPERRLHDDLSAHLEPARIASELAACRRRPGPLACVYVARTVYRFMPELVRTGERARVSALFGGSPSSSYDKNLLSSREYRTWYRPIVDFVRAQ
jgi:hypothetical protein